MNSSTKQTIPPSDVLDSVWKLFSLKGKVAVITGATGGIGCEIVRAYAEAGSHIAVWFSRSTQAEELCSEVIRKYGVNAKAYRVEITDSQEVDAAVDTVVRDMGGLDIMVLNAGISQLGDILSTTDSLWSNIMSVNLNAAMHCARAAGRVFREQRSGSLITTSSISAHIVNKPQIATAYNASKAALGHLTKSLAVEFAAFGARANTVSPGYVKTTINASLPEDLTNKWDDLTPMRRAADPRELKGVYLYLASPASSFCTGADILVDGGYTVY